LVKFVHLSRKVAGLGKLLLLNSVLGPTEVKPVKQLGAGRGIGNFVNNTKNQIQVFADRCSRYGENQTLIASIDIGVFLRRLHPFSKTSVWLGLRLQNAVYLSKGRLRELPT
jgi:hypothetical protein